MNNRYPEQTKRNVAAVYRAGVNASAIARTLNIPRSTIQNWIESKDYEDVSPADETILCRFRAGTMLTAKAGKKPSGFVKVAGEGPRPRESSMVIRKGSLTVEIMRPIDGADLVSLIKAMGECNVL